MSNMFISVDVSDSKVNIKEISGINNDYSKSLDITNYGNANIDTEISNVNNLDYILMKFDINDNDEYDVYVECRNIDDCECKTAVSFESEQTKYCAFTVVEFINTSDDEFTSYVWDFGDGSSPTSVKSPTHVYMNFEDDTTKSFDVTLTANNDKVKCVKKEEDYVSVDSSYCDEEWAFVTFEIELDSSIDASLDEISCSINRIDPSGGGHELPFTNKKLTGLRNASFKVPFETNTDNLKFEKDYGYYVKHNIKTYSQWDQEGCYLRGDYICEVYINGVYSGEFSRLECNPKEHIGKPPTYSMLDFHLLQTRDSPFGLLKEYPNYQDHVCTLNDSDLPLTVKYKISYCEGPVDIDNVIYFPRLLGQEKIYEWSMYSYLGRNIWRCTMKMNGHFRYARPGEGGQPNTFPEFNEMMGVMPPYMYSPINTYVDFANNKNIVRAFFCNISHLYFTKCINTQVNTDIGVFSNVGEFTDSILEPYFYDVVNYNVILRGKMENIVNRSEYPLSVSFIIAPTIENFTGRIDLVSDINPPPITIIGGNMIWYGDLILKTGDLFKDVYITTLEKKNTYYPASACMYATGGTIDGGVYNVSFTYTQNPTYEYYNHGILQIGYDTLTILGNPIINGTIYNTNYIVGVKEFLPYALLSGGNIINGNNIIANIKYL